MTLGAWLGFGFITLFIVAVCAGTGLYISEETKGAMVGVIIGFCISLVVMFGMLWYYGSTAAGARAMKTQESNFNRGINRTITVYDIEGDVIQQFSGKFDIEYDDDRIMFDDENNLRHIIYYPTGTVIIDENP
jgi:small-conductance mechanosensitive channel